MILITGIGRSGTQYTSQVLQKAGLYVYHENLGYHGTVCWKHAPFAENFKYIFHQVRNPLDCIGSMQTTHKSSMLYMAKFIPIDLGKSKLEQCMQAWLEWNNLCESKANAVYQIEKFDQVWDELLYQFDAPLVDLPKIPTDTNTRKGKYEPVTCEILHKQNGELFNEIIKLAKKYGYDF